MKINAVREKLKVDAMAAEPSPASPEVQRKNKLPLIAAIIIILILAKVYYQIKGYTRQMAASPKLPETASTDEAPVPPSLRPMPFDTGVKHIDGFSNAIAPLRIVTRPGSNYLVKIEEYPTGNRLMIAHVSGGDTLETKVPLGRYEIKYAAGETWYGAIDHFGPGTLYAKADRVFEFSRMGNQIAGHAIELFVQQNGNLATKGIAKSMF